VSTTEKEAVEITEDVEEVLRDAWLAARENLLMEFGKEIRDGFRCRKCLRLKGDRGYCEWDED
jgi:hypothetical protein